MFSESIVNKLSFFSIIAVSPESIDLYSSLSITINLFEFNFSDFVWTFNTCSAFVIVVNLESISSANVVVTKLFENNTIPAAVIITLRRPFFNWPSLLIVIYSSQKCQYHSYFLF